MSGNDVQRPVTDPYDQHTPTVPRMSSGAVNGSQDSRVPSAIPTNLPCGEGSPGHRFFDKHVRVNTRHGVGLAFGVREAPDSGSELYQ